MKRPKLFNFRCISLFSVWVSLCSVVFSLWVQPLSGQKNPLAKVISEGGTAGEYQAFPDMCRLKNGEIVAVFYAGNSHVTQRTDAYPDCGRICMVRSSDEGRSWSQPVTLYDDTLDNRDPHISQLKDGRLICTFFSIQLKRGDATNYFLRYPQYVISTDNGKTWESTPHAVHPDQKGWFCSAPVQQIGKRLLFPLYYSSGTHVYGGVVYSDNLGKSWSAPVPIGQEVQKQLPAETAIIRLKGGALYAGLRAEGVVPMHYAISRNRGESWEPARPLGFVGHAPSFTRLKNKAIVLTHRGFRKGADWSTGYTAARISYDEAQTWQGPYLVDDYVGAYPASLQLKDGSLLVIYYEEGTKSRVKVARFALPENKSESAPDSLPIPLKGLPL